MTSSDAMTQTWLLRVYYEDTDSMGRVYHANYLNFFERARTEFVREKGVNLETWQQRGIVFVVRHISVDFRRPAKFNDQLAVRTTLAEVSTASLTFSQSIEDAQTGEVVCQAQVQVVCVGIEAGTPQRIPVQLTMELQGGR